MPASHVKYESPELQSDDPAVQANDLPPNDSTTDDFVLIPTAESVKLSKWEESPYKIPDFSNLGQGELFMSSNAQNDIPALQDDLMRSEPTTDNSKATYPMVSPTKEAKLPKQYRASFLSDLRPEDLIMNPDAQDDAPSVQVSDLMQTQPTTDDSKETHAVVPVLKGVQLPKRDKASSKRPFFSDLGQGDAQSDSPALQANDLIQSEPTNDDSKETHVMVPTVKSVKLSKRDKASSKRPFFNDLGQGDAQNDCPSLQVNDLMQSEPTNDDSKETHAMVPVLKGLKLPKRDKASSKRPFLIDLKPGDLFMDDPKETDVIIPIIGITGVGKSSFINILLGQDDVAQVGHTLNSHTDHIQHFAYPHPHKPGSRIIVIDTPGFDHTTVDDREILRRIAVWLAQSYNANMKLAGIIYLHEISQCNMPPVQRNLDTFNKLCGPKAVKNVVLATTKWSDIPDNIAEEREKKLREHHWKDMIDRGSALFRYEGTQASAQGIVDQILAQEPLDAVQIQKELVDLNKILSETEAGRSLFYSLNDLLETQKRLGGHEGPHSDLHRVNDHKIRSALHQIKHFNYPPLSKKIKRWLEGRMRIREKSSL